AAAVPEATSKNMPLLAGAIGIAALVAIGLFWLISSGTSPQTGMAPATPAVSPPSKPAVTVARIKPPKKGAEWKNSLDMTFVPLGENHFSATKTRVRDFRAF